MLAISFTLPWFANTEMEELECPAQNFDLSLTEHLWEELVHLGLIALTSVPDLTKSHVAK